MGDYCQVCKRNFLDDNELVKHLRSSRNHLHDCVPCRRHFNSARARQQHLDYSKNHNICEPCNIDFDHPIRLENHNVETHNMCRDCREFFETPSNMEHHLQVHIYKDHKCPGCYRSFVSSAAMVLHLEAGTYRSGANRRLVDEAALESDPNGDFCTDDGEQCHFNCPACNRRFRLMSGLLQHGRSAQCANSSGTSVLANFDGFMRELSYQLRV